MKTTSTLVFALAAAFPLVAAHGILQEITIDGRKYEGPGLDKNNPRPSGIRQVVVQDPIKGANNPAINCGVDAKPAPKVHNADPGSQLTFKWLTASGGNWPHNTGPMLTYLASCGNQSCAEVDSSKVQWFKVHEAGRKDGKWEQQQLLDGGVASVPLPQNLAPGGYLVQHQIIALHLATQPGGAEFYSGCAQILVGGNEKGVPPREALVSMPGPYKDNDPGIFVPDVFNTNAQYQMPGPQIARLVATGAPNASPNGTQSGNEPSGQSGSGRCQLIMKAQTNTYRPRGISRIMRNLGIH